VQPPARQGFGSELIRRSLSPESGGAVTLDYSPDGLVCVMETPLPPRSVPANQRPAVDAWTH
jgi:two-component sensor histidine kinase